MKMIHALGKFIGFFLLFILTISFLWFFIYLLVPSPQKTVRSFFTNIKLEKYEKAYRLIEGKYKEKRGSLDKFSEEYRLAVESGTRTKKIVINTIKAGKEKNQRIVSVTVSVLYIGSVVDTQGSYLVEKIPGKGWRIVENVSNQENKMGIKSNAPMLQKSKP